MQQRCQLITPSVHLRIQRLHDIQTATRQEVWMTVYSNCDIRTHSSVVFC